MARWRKTRRTPTAENIRATEQDPAPPFDSMPLLAGEPGVALDDLCSQAREANVAALLVVTRPVYRDWPSPELVKSQLRLDIVEKRSVKTAFKYVPRQLLECQSVLDNWNSREVWTVRCAQDDIGAVVSHAQDYNLSCAALSRAWCDVPELAEALGRDVERLSIEALATSEDALKAILGTSTVFSRDTLTASPQGTSSGGCAAGRSTVEIIVASDARLITVETRIEVHAGETCSAAPCVNVVDLGQPRRITHLHGELVIECTAETEEPVYIKSGHIREIASYRRVPRTLTLKDPVSVSVLLSLVELGAHHRAAIT